MMYVRARGPLPPTEETKVKVRIEMTVEVDVGAWALEYGIEPGDVREDVRNYIINGVAECPLGQSGDLKVVKA
jgi:hypothetical protein